MADDSIIVIKKGKGGHGGAHGGAWKVAFADFTLAMMAFFMVLWLMASSESTQRAGVADAINGDMMLEGSTSPFDLSSNPSLLLDLESNIVEPSIKKESSVGAGPTGLSLRNQVPEGELGLHAGQGDEMNALVPGDLPKHAQLEAIAKQLDEAIEDLQMQNNVTIEVVEQGIRILIHDSEEQSMFRVGQADLQPYFEDLLLAFAPMLSEVPHGFTMSGHTDALPFTGYEYSNWELSSERALVARRTLAFGGVRPEQMIQVSGMADTALYLKSDPYNPKNRRIELMILTEAASKQLTDLIHGEYLSKAEEKAVTNRSLAVYDAAISTSSQP